MKNLLLIIILGVLSLNSFGQIQEILKVPKSLIPVNVADNEVLLMDEEYNPPILNITLYNFDNSVVKSITINLTDYISYIDVSSNIYSCGVKYISRNIFNEDTSDFEFIIYPNWFRQSHPMILNDEGNVIYDLEHHSAYAHFFLTSSLETPILVVDYYTDTTNTTILYSLPGKMVCNSCNTVTINDKKKYLGKKGNYLDNSYPNPSNNYTIIPYQLPINEKNGTIRLFSSNGKHLKTYKINNHFDHLRIETSNLPKGIILYNLSTENGFSETKKLIVE